MDADELDKALREFRKEHPPRQPKRPKHSRTNMDQLIDCIEAQLDALENADSNAPPVA